jgi:hypothetical protein
MKKSNRRSIAASVRNNDCAKKEVEGQVEDDPDLARSWKRRRG